MCYNVSTLTKPKEVYTQLYAPFAQDEEFTPYFFTTGFSHHSLPVITTESKEIEAFQWGLIPFWTKDKQSMDKLSNSCLNARSETMFQKPSFKVSAKNKRCLIIVDSFFEYRHYKGKAYPYLIKLKHDNPFCLAGLWDVTKVNNQTYQTCSIVTTSANAVMSQIHNNPRVKEPRMPVILPREKEKEWLSEYSSRTDENYLLSLAQPIEDQLMEFFTVAQLTGQNGTGNTSRAMEKIEYLFALSSLIVILVL